MRSSTCKRTIILCGIGISALSMGTRVQAADWFLIPVFFSDINEFNNANYFTAQAYDPTVPFNTANTTHPAPNGTSFPSQNGAVNALPGGAGGSQNEFALNSAGLNFTTNQVSVSDGFNFGNASVTGQIELVTSVSLPYGVVNSFVGQQTHREADHPESWDAMVTLTDLTANTILYRQSDAPDFQSTLGNQYGTLPSNHAFKLEFTSHSYDTAPDGEAFGNGVLNFSVGNAPEPAALSLLAFASAGLLVKRRRVKI
jgi:hypothetical protein